MPDDPELAPGRPELPMRLTRLRVKNFRSIADIDIPLSPLTVLVGPNGSGKSNVVDALRFVRDVFARGLDQAVINSERDLQRWGSGKKGISIGVTMRLASREIDGAFTTESEIINRSVEWPASTVSYDFTINNHPENGSFVVEAETISIDLQSRGIGEINLKRTNALINISFEGNTWKEVKLDHNMSRSELLLPDGIVKLGGLHYFPDNGGSKLESQAWFIHFRYQAEYFKDEVIKQLFYKFNPANFRQPQRFLKETHLDEEGHNLAAVLRRLSLSNNVNWENLRFALRQAVTGFDALEVEQVGGYLATKLIYQTDTMQPRASYLGQESDGTIRMLGILAALYQDPAQPFLSIEEPEANIHPGALAVLASVLDEASLRGQVLVTTHSPDMLDHLPAESFLVVEKVGDTTHVGPLDASQLASVRKRLFTPGELLRMEGLQRQADTTAA